MKNIVILYGYADKTAKNVRWSVLDGREYEERTKYGRKQRLTNEMTTMARF